MKKALDDLLREADLFCEDYALQYAYIRKMIEDGKISPIRSSGTNGKTPPLFSRYMVIREKKDHSAALHELTYTLHPRISTDYYRKHVERYENERDHVLKLNAFILQKEDLLAYPVSVNERSYQIWQDEKFLESPGAQTVLGHCRIDQGYLNVYTTSEPLAYFAVRKSTPQTIVIIENKDPFYSMRKALLSGTASLLGEDVSTLLYGGGKRILRSFSLSDVSCEDYLKAPGNRFLYFGDLDYEGIGIYETVAGRCTDPEIVPFTKAYCAMLAKAEGIQLARTKEKQNRNISDRFFSYFDPDTVTRMQRILQDDRYIPQEILNITDYMGQIL